MWKSCKKSWALPIPWICKNRVLLERLKPFRGLMTTLLESCFLGSHIAQVATRIHDPEVISCFISYRRGFFAFFCYVEIWHQMNKNPDCRNILVVRFHTINPFSYHVSPYNPFSCPIGENIPRAGFDQKSVKYHIGFDYLNTNKVAVHNYWHFEFNFMSNLKIIGHWTPGDTYFEEKRSIWGDTFKAQFLMLWNYCTLHLVLLIINANFQIH